MITLRYDAIRCSTLRYVTITLLSEKWGNSLGTTHGFVRLLVGCLTSQQHARVSQGRIYSDNFTCCHTDIEIADQTFYLTRSQYTDTSPSADPITPGAWQGSHWSANFEVTGMTRPRKNPGGSGIRLGFEPGIFRSRGGLLNHSANEAVHSRHKLDSYNANSVVLLLVWRTLYNRQYLRSNTRPLSLCLDVRNARSLL